MDEQEVNRGKGTDALGDQWKAAVWLVNTMVESGWKMEPGHVVITGALGKMIPGRPGKYVADYGGFGKISFEIK
jgi:2-keto-4-pentenoate hydratase